MSVRVQRRRWERKSAAPVPEGFRLSKRGESNVPDGRRDGGEKNIRGRGCRRERYCGERVADSSGTSDTDDGDDGVDIAAFRRQRWTEYSKFES